MCGIAGFVNRVGPPSDPILQKQLELLTHRGPDSSGAHRGSCAVVGQTRLAIIDLVTGDPPIANETGEIGVALNGEIYNYRELRKSLDEKGHKFRTRGDTEVIAHLAEELDGPELAQRLDGMFAIALWDEGRRRLTLIRDRFGKKPLFYWEGEGSIVFASEIKALLVHPSVPSAPAPGAIDAYLTFGYVPTPRTFFDGIRSVPPGHILEMSPGEEPVVTRYWQPPLRALASEKNEPADLKEAGRAVRSRLEGAVRKRLISDVPLGAFLSGGIDSSAIVGLMAREIDRPVSTFTIGFEDSHGYDERPYARMVADRFHTEHHEFVVAPRAVDLVERLVWHHDQPFGDSSAVPTYLLSELTRREVTVALSGDGGDELFAGYERFAAALALDRYRRLPKGLRALIASAIRVPSPSAFKGRAGSFQRFTERAHQEVLDAYLDWLSFAKSEQMDALLPGRDGWGPRDYRDVWAESAGRPLLDRLQALNIRTYLVDDLLVKADRMSMAHGLEVRSPFLDKDLAACALTLSPEVRLRGFSLKRVLKEAVKDLLPDEIIRRRKKGFGVPLDRWFREDLRSYMGSKLGRDGAAVRRYVEGAAIDRFLQEHDEGKANHGQLLWALLTLEVFLERVGW